MKRYKIAVLISGRGSNMEALIDNILNGELGSFCTVEIVISNNPDAGGLEIARGKGVKTEVIESRGRTRREFETCVVDTLQRHCVDYVILAGFNRIISPFMVNSFPKRIINIHPADTNEYKGLHGYEWAYENKLNRTKITVHYVDEGVDTGEIILQKDVNLLGATSLDEVVRRGLRVEHESYSLALIKVFTGKN